MSLNAEKIGKAVQKAIAVWPTNVTFKRETSAGDGVGGTITTETTVATLDVFLDDSSISVNQPVINDSGVVDRITNIKAYTVSSTAIRIDDYFTHQGTIYKVVYATELVTGTFQLEIEVNR